MSALFSVLVVRIPLFFSMIFLYIGLNFITTHANRLDAIPMKNYVCFSFGRC
jgi:hypothetical protein